MGLPIFSNVKHNRPQCNFFSIRPAVMLSPESLASTKSATL